MTLLHTHKQPCPLLRLPYKVFDLTGLSRHSQLPPAECYSCIPPWCMSRPFHSADLQPVVRLSVLTWTICSSSQSHTHTNTDAYDTHTDAQHQLSVARVHARGRLLHLSLCNVSPLDQWQLAPISSPLGLSFIKGTVMYTAACSRLTSSSHR